MNSKRYQAYSIRFTPEELADLRALAEREQMPASEVIRKALESFRQTRLGPFNTRAEAAGTRLMSMRYTNGSSSETESDGEMEVELRGTGSWRPSTTTQGTVPV